MKEKGEKEINGHTQMKEKGEIEKKEKNEGWLTGKQSGVIFVEWTSTDRREKDNFISKPQNTANLWENIELPGWVGR
jgi:hypothetical protein